MGSSEKIGEAETETAADCLCPPSCSAHDITSMSDLLPRRMKTKVWPMSPIETFTEEEVLAIANRDNTPVMIATLDGDTNGEQYLCGNKRGASLPPEIIAEGSWAQKYYQQVAVLNDTLKEMQESFQPVWELAKSQQALLVAVEIYDGLLTVANQGMQLRFKTWDVEYRKAIITRECDFRTHRQADYYTVLKNYTAGRFNSLDPDRLRSVEELLTAGETYLMQHARTNGFECPSEVRTAFQEFVPLKKERNQYSHPLTLSGKTLAYTVLRKLRVSLLNDEFDFIKGTKNLMLLGADYAETVLENYGKLRDKLFLDPNKRSPQRFQITYSQGPSPIHSPGPASPGPNQEASTTGEGSQTFELNQPFDDARSPESPPNSSAQSPLGSPLVLTYPDFSRSLRPSQQLPSAEVPSPNQSLYIGRTRPRNPQDTSPESFPTDRSHSADAQPSSETIRSPRPHKRPRL
ncbi:hypothetical protein R1sor_017157 [Riccia sorocarpa]|uniref:Gag protein n=1 Tax=Riccia sorocarpa TaxID=122646 RepID=A0ABD3I605_9MARC